MRSLKDELRRRKREQDSKRFVTDEELKTLMSNINMELVLKSIGVDVKPVHTKEGEYVGYCPDHEIYTGRRPSHPKWYINSITGKCFCMTENRASNLLSVMKNVLNLSNEREVYYKLLDGKEIEVPVTKPKFAEVQQESKVSLELEEKKKLALSKIEKVLDEGKFSEEEIKYFEKDGIRIETLKKYGVSVCKYGAYKDRAIIPFFNEKTELIGFIAVDYLGKEEWIKRRKEEFRNIEGDSKIDDKTLTEEVANRYKKTLYCPGFSSGKHLYGLYEKFDNPKRFDYLVLVEGERDCLKLMQEGINCVSVHGSSLKREQVVMIQKISPYKVFLGFDMDDAGNKAVKQSMEVLQDKIEDIYVLNFPDGKDPKKFNHDELISFMKYAEENNIKER